MSNFLVVCLVFLVTMVVLGWRIGWLTQVLWYALFALFISGSLLLNQELESIYKASGVPDHVAGLTALITIVVFSGLLVIPALRIHKIFYERRSFQESFRKPGGALLGALVALLLIYSLGRSLLRYEIVDSESEAYNSIEMRIIRAIDGNETISTHQPKTFRPEQ